MSHGSPRPALDSLIVRTFQEGDQSAVSRLYTEGLLAGQIAANDTGADVENIHEAYLAEPESHFWVAEADGHVLGMIGVARDREHTAEVRRLRVEKRYQGGPIGVKLMETALAHCKRVGYIKVVLDTRFDPDAVLDLFDKFGFQHTRTKNMHDKELLEFYLDLYRQPRQDKD